MKWLNAVAMQTLTLTASDTNWRLFTLRRSDPNFSNFQEKILERNGYTCGYCGFQSKLHMSVVNIDGDYHHNKAANLTTACPFCMQCHFLESVGQGEFGGGTLIHLPDISQAQLNASCHAMFSAMCFGTEYVQKVGALYRGLKLLSQPVEEELGQGMHQPAMLGRLMLDTPKNQLSKIQALLDDKVRLLPSMVRYIDQTFAWSMEALHELAGGSDV